VPASRLHRHQSPAGYPQLKRLLIRPGAIGDCIVSLPALEHLKTDYTEVWTAGANAPLIRFAHRVRSIVATGIDSFPPRFEALEPFDDIVSWYGANRQEFREAASRYPIRFFEALPSAPGIHAVDYFMRQVGGGDGAIPRIDVPRTDNGFIAIHPYSGSTKKNWPHFAELASRIGKPVRFCVSPEQSWPEAVRYDDLYDLAKWLATASLYIGNDSGITHLAAAVGVPVVAIFQASDPSVWSPRGHTSTLTLLNPTIEGVLERLL
jgi:lipopolysaccharide heptosyltransferase III